MNASGQIECNDDSSMQLVRSNDASNISESSQSAG